MGREQGTDFNTGNPNTFTEQWPQYHNDTKKYLKIMYKPQVSEYYRSSKMAFWRSFVPGLKMVSRCRSLLPSLKISISSKLIYLKVRLTWSNLK